MSEGSPASADVPDESKSAQESASSSSDRLGRFRKRLIGVLKSGLSAIFACHLWCPGCILSYSYWTSFLDCNTSFLCQAKLH